MGLPDYSKAIRKSQHCQRNWDLTKKVSQEDLELFKIAVTECPSKQNMAFYNVCFITNRDIIERIHDATDGFSLNLDKPEQTVTNSQALANLLVVFEEIPIFEVATKEKGRNVETWESTSNEGFDKHKQSLLVDQNLAIGIAAGYLNLMSSILGYSTGCCSCFDSDKVKTILGLEYEPALLMGVGFSNTELGRRVHHKDHDFLFPTKQKQEIKFKLFE